MLARWLRWILLAFLLLSGLLVAWLRPDRAGAAVMWALPALVAILLVVTLAVTLATYVAAAGFRIHQGGVPALEASPLGLLGSVPGEWLALHALYTIAQPFEAWLPADRPPRRASGPACAVLVHGYFCNRGLWWWMRRQLAVAGIPAATFDLEPPHGSIETFAEQLHLRIDALGRELGGDARLVVVAHSMGGLVTREMIRRHGAERIAKVITLGSPHAGTMLAYLGLGRCAREMQPGSAFLQRLATAWSPAVPFVTVRSTADNFMAPSTTPRLPGSREITLDGLGHLALVFSPRVRDIVIEEIRALDDSAPVYK